MIVVLSVFLVISFYLAFRGQPDGITAAENLPPYKGQVTVDQGILHGEATAPKLENATLKFASLSAICEGFS
jgi:FAD-linked sulfhydryl oxidase